MNFNDWQPSQRERELHDSLRETEGRRLEWMGIAILLGICVFAFLMTRIFG